MSWVDALQWFGLACGVTSLIWRISDWSRARQHRRGLVVLPPQRMTPELQAALDARVSRQAADRDWFE